MKRVVVHHHFSYGELRFTEQEVQQHIEHRAYVEYSREPFVKFRIPTHAITNWNMRVGPVVNRERLETMFRALSHQKHRIRLYGRKGYGLIDEDILFVHQKSADQTWAIVTLYGRVSINPPIFSIPLMSVPRINLKQTNRILKQQTAPIFPSSGISLSVDGKHRYLERYCIGRNRHMYVLTNPRADVLAVGALDDMPRPIQSIEAVWGSLPRSDVANGNDKQAL